MKNIFIVPAACLMFLCLSRMPAEADAGDCNGASAAESRFVSMSLFKNGLGFIYSEADIPGRTQRILLKPVPPPVHGTFWLYPGSDGVSISDARAFTRTVSTLSPAENMAELMKLNAGNKVIIQIGGKTVIGRIVSVNRGLVIMDTGAGTVAFEGGAARELSVLEGEFRTHSEKSGTENVIEIIAGIPPEGGRIGIQYLAKGITWAPSCSVDITDPVKARLLANAEIINEIGDLENVTVKFVSGFPNFRFSEVVSPIALQGNLASFLNSLAHPSRGTPAPVMRQALGVYDRARAEVMPVSGYAADPEGTGVEDLFFYEREGVTLGRGERGYYPLYELKVPYEHIYRWDVPDFIDAQDRYRRDVQDEDAEEVWHSVRLKNTGKVPWTTSPAMVTRAGQIIAQDTLNYTSPGAESNLRITRAMDVKARQEEFEVSRKRSAAVFYGTHYDLVEVKGVLEAANYKNSGIVLTVYKMISGEILSITPEAGVETIARGLRRVNPRHRLNWKVPIDAGEEIKIEYRYEVYVRN